MLDFSNAVIRRVSSWDELKKYLDGRYRTDSLQWEQDVFGYTVFCINSSMVVTYFIKNEDTADLADFVANWKDRGNRNINPDNTGIFKGSNCRPREETIDISTTNNTNPTVFEKTFVYSINFICAYTFANWEEFDKRDYFNLFFYPCSQGAIGIVTEEAQSGQTIVKVSSTVLVCAIPGDFVKIGSEDHWYQVKTVGTDSIELTENLNYTKSVDDAVYIRVYLINKGYLLPNTKQYWGEKYIGFNHICVGATMRLEYYHYTTPTSAWNFWLSMLYYHGK